MTQPSLALSDQLGKEVNGGRDQTEYTNILKCQLASDQVIFISEKVTFLIFSSGAGYKLHSDMFACFTYILEQPKNHL